MRFHKIIYALMAVTCTFLLTSCGSQTKVVHKKATPMTYNNITGGNSVANHSVVVHNIAELKSTLKKDKNKPKDILINSNLNGNTDGYLQDKIQLSENKLNSRIHQLGQKPKVVTTSRNLNGVNKKTIANNKKKAKHQWKNQQNEKKKLQQVAKQRKQAFNQLMQQKTLDTKVKIPSNTTIAEDPNTQLRNITFITHGRNVIFRNLNMQAPYNYAPNQNGTFKNDAILVSHADGVEFSHDTFTNADNPVHANKPPKVNKKNKKMNNNQKQHPQVNSLNDILDGSKHVVITKSRYTNMNKAIMIGNPTTQQGSNGVIIKNNLFDDVAQSAPEIYSSQVQLNNNYYYNDNSKQNKYRSIWNSGKGATIMGKHNTAMIAKASGYKVAQQLITQNKNQQIKDIKAQLINVNKHNLVYVSKNKRLNILKSQSIHQAPSINLYANDGAVLGRNEALE